MRSSTEQPAILLTENSATLTFANHNQEGSEKKDSEKHERREKATGRSLKEIQKKTHPGVSAKNFVHPYQGQDNPAINTFTYTDFDSAFASMAHTAFAQHKSIEMRPDDIHLLIVQGLTNFIQQYPEDFRKSLVSFDDKQQVKMYFDSYAAINDPEIWDFMPRGFAGMIRQLINSKETADILLQDYSQTTETDRTVKAVTLMGAFSSYLNYNVATLCHIPQFVLQGTVEDWRKISEMPQQLISQLQLHEKQDNEKETGMHLLHRWLTRLQPVLNNMYQSRMGKVDPEFWNSFYKFNESSGGDRVTGNIVYFYPFLKAGDGQSEQKVLNGYIMGEEISLGKGLFHEGPGTSQLPANFVDVAFKLEHKGKIYDMGMQAGIVAHTEDQEQHHLHSHVDYSIYYKNAVPPDATLVGKNAVKSSENQKSEQIEGDASAAASANQAKKTIHFDLVIDDEKQKMAAKPDANLQAVVPPITARHDPLYAVFKRGFFSGSSSLNDQLLQYVVLANWDKVEAIIKNNPELMLEVGSAVDVTCNKINMTPLQYAYYANDKHMQDLFEKYAEKLQSQIPYETQILNQKDSFDYSPFFKEYDESLILSDLFDKKYHEYASKRMDQERSQAFHDQQLMFVRKLGAAQCNMIPRHMLKQFLASENYQDRGHYDWSVSAKFDGPVPRGVCFAMSEYLDWEREPERRGDRSFDPAKIDFDEIITRTGWKLGVDALCERGDSWIITQQSGMCHDRTVHIDRQVFANLIEIRQEQQEARIAKMTQARMQRADAEPVVKMQRN